MNSIPTPQSNQVQNPTAADVLHRVTTATPLQLNGPMELEELDGFHERVLQAQGVKLVIGQLTDVERELWFRIEPGSPDALFRTYLRKPFPGAPVIIDIFGVANGGTVVVGPGWSTDGAPGSSVAHGSKGFARREYAIHGGFPIHLFRVALLNDFPAPAGPFVFLATKK